VAQVISDYARSWSLLQGYDEQSLGEELFYPNVATRAAHLLYFIIKNHPLADGNKRSGSFLFLWYLRINQHLLAKPVEQLINDNTLVALALLVAESLSDQKELMIRLAEHFIFGLKLLVLREDYFGSKNCRSFVFMVIYQPV